MAFFGLGAEEYDRIYSDRELLKRILSYFKPYRLKSLIVILFLTLTSFSYALIPIFSREAINHLEISKDPVYIYFIIVISLILNLLAWIFNYYRQKNSVEVVGDVVLNLRRDVNEAVLNHDLSFFDKYPTGKIVSRINTDSRDFGTAAALFLQTLSSFFIVFIILIALLLINPYLTLIVIGMIPVVFFIALLFRKIARRVTLLGQRALAVVNAYVQESISGIQIAKTFRQEQKLYEKFKFVNDQSYNVNLRRAWWMNTIFPTLGVVQGVALALVVYYGGITVLAGEISPGDFYLFINALFFLFFPLLSLASFFPIFQTGLAASERIFALIDQEPLVIQRDNFIPDRIRGEISFDNLTFEYTAGQKIFDEFSLTIHSGESVAIVGHTGAGKSSLAKLLSRFYEFQNGDILIDGRSIRDFDLKAYRKHVGIIPQTPFLWADTLENNVKYSRPEATKNEILWALEQAGGKDWIDYLPQGLNTNIRERGSLLSMGQRQLVVFARVLLENPSILILDEATASVDPFTETRIQEALEKTIKGRTSIIIAHRLWTVRKVDRIIVLDHGKIVEEGNHEILMNKGGKYAQLYEKYFRHQSLQYIEQAKNLD